LFEPLIKIASQNLNFLDTLLFRGTSRSGICKILKPQTNILIRNATHLKILFSERPHLDPALPEYEAFGNIIEFQPEIKRAKDLHHSRSEMSGQAFNFSDLIQKL